MKQTLILIFSFFAIALSAQTDTLDSKIVTNYLYQQENGKHYYTIVTVHADSSETIQRIPFARRRDVMDYAKYQAEIADSMLNVVTGKIKTVDDNITNLQNQIKEYNENVNREYARYVQELRMLRTQRKLIRESKEKNNNIR